MRRSVNQTLCAWGPVDAAPSLRHIISMKVEIAAKRLEALGNPTRLEIYRLLVRAGHSGMAVGQVQSHLDLPGSTLSHHLRRLVECGLIRQERNGTTRFCHAEYDVMDALLGYLSNECCAADPANELKAEASP